MSSVYVYIYDLSKGLAKQLSFMFIGKHIEGVWHTGIVAYGREWFFGGNGIESVLPKGTILGPPDKIEFLGNTEINESDFLEMIQQLSEGPFALGTYHLLHHNCNTFSNQMAQFLLGKTIPSYIVDLPNEILKTPIGPMLESMFAQAHTLKSDVDDIPISHIGKSGRAMPISSSDVPLNDVKSKQTKINEPVIYKPEIKNVLAELIAAKNNFGLNDDEKYLFDELILFSTKSYLEQTQITWSIGTGHIKLMYKILNKSENIESKINILKIFQLISTDTSVSRVFKSDLNQIKTILGGLKSQNIKIIENYFQWFANLVSNFELNEWFMNEQEFIFSHLSEFVLYDVVSNKNIQQFCIAFFYNLLCIFDRVYTRLSESSGLSLGCALIELIQSEKFENDKIVYILDLLQVCCAESNELKEYIQSIGGLCLNKYIHDEKCKSIIDTINKHLLIQAE